MSTLAVAATEGRAVVDALAADGSAASEHTQGVGRPPRRL